MKARIMEHPSSLNYGARGVEVESMTFLSAAVSSPRGSRFGAVVSNPPYQVNVGGERNNGAANPIWQEFIGVASQISLHSSFVNPGRWMRGTRRTGLAPTREYFLTGGHLVEFTVFKDVDLFDDARVGDMTVELFDFTCHGDRDGDRVSTCSAASASPDSTHPPLTFTSPDGAAEEVFTRDSYTPTNPSSNVAPRAREAFPGENPPDSGERKLQRTLRRGFYSRESGILYEVYSPENSLDIVIPHRDEELVRRVLESNVFAESVEGYLWAGGEYTRTKRPSSVVDKNPNNNYAIRTPRFYRDTDYFITAQERKEGVEYIKLYYSPRTREVDVRYLPLSEIQESERTMEYIHSWKSLIPKTNAHLLYRNLGPLGEPMSLPNNTWLARCFASLEEVENFNSYLRTYLYRYLVSIRATSHNAYANVHRWVPDLSGVENPRTGMVGYGSDWRDDDLRAIFQGVLTEEDWSYIKATAMAADGGRGDYEAGYELPMPHGWSELRPGKEWSSNFRSLTLDS